MDTILMNYIYSRISDIARYPHRLLPNLAYKINLNSSDK